MNCQLLVMSANVINRSIGIDIPVQVMVISVISVSSDSSKDNVGTSTGRVILFGTIPTTIPDTTLSVIPPTTYIDTTLIPIISPTIPPSPDYTPTSPDYSPTSDTEFDPSEDPSSDHIPPLPATLPFLSSTNDSSDSDILDTPPSPTHVPSIPRSSTAIFDRPSHDSSSASPSRKRSRSPHASVLLSSPTLVALSYVRVDLLPSPKRIRSSKSAMNLEVSTAKGSEPSRYRGTGLEIDVDVLLVVVEAIESRHGNRAGPIEVRVDRVTHPVVADDIPKPAQEGAVEVTHELGRMV
ncbi:hypothetical protein Tco_1093814 [Tanacetum coccineum]|uniref:Uncharacterized protein n=1 Tax=Tanacetum coccineum TaxID=301880 RepID=A0ABQ5IDS3_9ASTR